MQLLLKTLVCVVLKMISFLFVFLLFNNHIFFRLFIPPVYAKFSLKMKSRIQKKPLTIISNSPHLKPRVGFQPTTLSNSFAGQ